MIDRIEQLYRWLDIDSTTGSERDYLRALEGDLEELGLRVQRQPVSADRWNILAEPPGGPAELLLCTHVDTVPPFFGVRVDDDGNIRARGACDTKGGLFAMFEAYRAMPADHRGRVGFLLVVGEEVDHIGAIVASKERYPSLRATILGEPTRNQLASGQKGILKVTVTADGVAGHSAFPESGRSAIHALIDALAALSAHDWPSDPVLGPTTYNVGEIRGGVAANVFAPLAEATVLFRTVSDGAALLRRVRDVAGGGVQVDLDCANEPMRLCHWDGFATDVVPFNTDAPYLANTGPIVLAGPGDIRNAHSSREHIRPVDIEMGVSLYGRLCSGLLDGDLVPGAGS